MSRVMTQVASASCRQDGDGAAGIHLNAIGTLQWPMSDPRGPVDAEYLRHLARQLAAAGGSDWVLIARIYDSVLPPPVLRVVAASESELDLRSVEAMLAQWFAGASADLVRGQSWSAVADAIAPPTADIPSARAWTSCDMVPILVGGALWGLICMAKMRKTPAPGIALAVGERAAPDLAARIASARPARIPPDSFLSEALDCAAEPLVVYDSDLRVAWYNKAWRAMMNYLRPGEDLHGLSLVDIHHLNVAKGYWSPERADEVFRDIASGRFAIERTTSIGASHMRHRNYPIGSGGFIGLRTDISDMVHRHYELAEARDRAMATSMAKSSFLANVSHELRTPLNAIVGFSELMLHGVFGSLANERYAGYVEDIYRSGLLLQSLIDDLLDMARIEAGKTELRPEVTEPGQLIDDVLRLLRLRATRRDQQLTIDLPPDLPAVMVDRRSTTQILLNVIGNAIKFTQRGGVIRLSSMVENGEMLKITVRDNGPGIDPKALPRLGRPFERADSDQIYVAHESRGTGLGLAISRSLAEGQGGALHIESHLGDGTTVELLLPLADLANLR